jgi:hypothetical protein
MKVRILLLRLLLGWWMVPFIWMVVLPLTVLLVGVREGFEGTREMGKVFLEWHKDVKHRP